MAEIDKEATLHYLLRNTTPDLEGPFESFEQAKNYRHVEGLDDYTIVRIRAYVSDRFTNVGLTAAERHIHYPLGG